MHHPGGVVATYILRPGVTWIGANAPPTVTQTAKDLEKCANDLPGYSTAPSPHLTLTGHLAPTRVCNATALVSLCTLR